MLDIFKLSPNTMHRELTDDLPIKYLEENSCQHGTGHKATSDRNAETVVQDVREETSGGYVSGELFTRSGVPERPI